MRFLSMWPLFGATSIVLALGAQSPAVVTPKHPEVARTARLQGTVTVQLAVSSDGDVIAAEPNSTDALLKAHPILQCKTAELLRRWKFTCSNCSEDGSYTYDVTFIYKLDGKESAYDETRVAVDWPDRVTITANPPIVNGD